MVTFGGINTVTGKLSYAHFIEVSQDDAILDQNFMDFRSQVAVAIGGDVLDLPLQTAPVRIHS